MSNRRIDVFPSRYLMPDSRNAKNHVGLKASSSPLGALFSIQKS
jgi:hypothetical protein